MQTDASQGEPIGISVDHQRDILRSFERGRRLFILTHNEGWQDVLDIMEAEVVASEFRLMNVPAGSTSDLVRDLLMDARARRAMFERTQLKILADIEQGKKTPFQSSPDLSKMTEDEFMNYNL
jgi:hypothetical protein